MRNTLKLTFKSLNSIYACVGEVTLERVRSLSYNYIYTEAKLKDQHLILSVETS